MTTVGGAVLARLDRLDCPVQQHFFRLDMDTVRCVSMAMLPCSVLTRSVMPGKQSMACMDLACFFGASFGFSVVIDDVRFFGERTYSLKLPKDRKLLLLI